MSAQVVVHFLLFTVRPMESNRCGIHGIDVQRDGVPRAKKSVRVAVTVPRFAEVAFMRP